MKNIWTCNVDDLPQLIKNALKSVLIIIIELVSDEMRWLFRTDHQINGVFYVGRVEVVMSIINPISLTNLPANCVHLQGKSICY